MSPQSILPPLEPPNQANYLKAAPRASDEQSGFRYHRSSAQTQDGSKFGENLRISVGLNANLPDKNTRPAPLYVWFAALRFITSKA